ncbi:MAG: methyltransferase domain-containing protein [Chloroflexi bacterium]|nr:methyltransferase domain-containing protein [Chloroflexota bacterium]
MNLPQRPSAFLVRNLRLLPRGKALDIAAGEGRNALYLARKGFQVDAVDISAEKVATLSGKACQLGLPVRGIVADLETGCQIPPAAYELIICFNYLQRSLFPRIEAGLKSGGVLLYETFTIDQTRFGKPRNPDYLLKHGELKAAFGDLQCLRYWEGIVGNRKAVARMIARKMSTCPDTSGLSERSMLRFGEPGPRPKRRGSRPDRSGCSPAPKNLS